MLMETEGDSSCNLRVELIPSCPMFASSFSSSSSCGEKVTTPVSASLHEGLEGNSEEHNKRNCFCFSSVVAVDLADDSRSRFD